MRRRAAAALAVLLLGSGLLAGCADDTAPGAARIDVDTPSLREAKAAAGVADCTPGTGSPVQGGLPQVTMPCFGGGPSVDLASLRGPLVVNVWATSCGPCRREMPLLEKFHQAYGDQVGVIGVDYQDPTTGLAMDLVRKTGVTYPLVADTQGALGASSTLPVRALPTTALVASDGTVSFVRPLELTSVDQLKALVEEHLGVTL